MKATALIPVVGGLQVDLDVTIEEVNGKFHYTFEFGNGQVMKRKFTKKYKFGFFTFDAGQYKNHHNHMEAKQLVNKFYQIENLYDEIAVFQFY